MTFKVSGIRDDFAAAMSGQPGFFPAPALDNFVRVFAIRPDDQVALLVDRRLDPAVTKFIWDFARGRGAAVEAYTIEAAGAPTVPETAKPLIERATFLVSTWFPSILDPYLAALRAEKGQRWVKITYFRNLSLLHSAAAQVPLDLISALLRQTAGAYAAGQPAEIHVIDRRGTDLRIEMDARMVTRLLAQSRWRGELTAERAGAYVHYLPTHGPNFYDCTMTDGDEPKVNGIVYPQAGIGFDESFPDDVSVEMRDNRVVAVGGKGDASALLRDMLDGSQLIEIGCGFNPKFPRRQIYPAGSNAPGAIHFGLDLPRESGFLKRTVPDWPEPPVHQDLVGFDCTVSVNGRRVVDGGRLCALGSDEVRTLAARYGTADDVLEGEPA